MTADAIERFLGAGIRNAGTHRVIVRLRGVFMTAGAQFHDIRHQKKTLVRTGVWLMAVTAIFKGNCVLIHSLKAIVIVTRKTGLCSFLDLERRAVSDVRPMA